jgi:hypothetical protein
MYGGNLSMTRLFLSTVLSLSLIVVGAAIYEYSFVYDTHPLVFVMGTTLVLAGGLTFAEDWLGL